MRLRRRAAAGIRHDQDFHQVVVGREGRRLDDEGVLAAHVLLDLDEDFHVGEAPHLALGQGHAEIGGNRLRQSAIGVTRQDLHASCRWNATGSRRRLLAATRRRNNAAGLGWPALVKMAPAEAGVSNARGSDFDSEPPRDPRAPVLARCLLIDESPQSGRSFD